MIKAIGIPIRLVVWLLINSILAVVVPREEKLPWSYVRTGVLN
jgi:hypothetical protein